MKNALVELHVFYVNGMLRYFISQNYQEKAMYVICIENKSKLNIYQACKCCNAYFGKWVHINLI